MYPRTTRANPLLTFLNDGVNDITAFPDPNNPEAKLLSIAGTSFNNIAPFQTGSIATEIFFLLIDENGSIQSQYHNTNNTHLFHSPDQIWDENLNLLVTVFEGWNALYNVYDSYLIRLNPDLTLTPLDNMATTVSQTHVIILE